MFTPLSMHHHQIYSRQRSCGSAPLQSKIIDVYEDGLAVPGGVERSFVVCACKHDIHDSVPFLLRSFEVKDL
jgi:hypothetical protein